GNARDAVMEQAEPRIDINLVRYEPDEAFLSAHPEADASAYAMLSVKDNGCGIPEKHLDRIFEPFFTSKGVGEGSGLGLSMAFGAMKNHRGFIEVQSAVGEGTTFRLFFPLSDTDEEPGLSEESVAWRGHGERLLLADDEPIVRDTIGEMLRIDGFTVDLAEDGQDAVEQFAAQPEAYDAVILDVVMPRMGGMGAAHRMREIRPDIPIIFATGYDRDHVLRGVDGMQGVVSLSKPLHSANLRQTLGRLLGQ
ncbi:MAG: response regulator, partial [Mariprofundaceae bacterium]|nr:response regulator [Mariprofundaceae bacterium]